MTANNHLIQKVTLEIGLPEQKGAYEIQNRLSHSFSTTMMSRLENLFDQYAGSDVSISIDRLELDLGTVVLQRLETEFMEVLQKKMQEFLQRTRQEITNAAGEHASLPAHLGLSIRWNTEQTQSPEIQITRTMRTQSVLDKVCYLLIHGTLPPSHQELTGQRLSVLIDEILATHAEEFIARISSMFNPVALQRLLLNLTESQLLYLVSLSGCRFADKLPGIVSQLTRQFAVLPRLNPSRALPAGIVFPDTAKMVWWHVLTAFLHTKRCYKQHLAETTTAARFSHTLLLDFIVCDQFLTADEVQIVKIRSTLTTQMQTAAELLCAQLLTETNTRKVNTIFRELVRYVNPDKKEKKPTPFTSPAVKHKNIFEGLNEETSSVVHATYEEQPVDHSLYITNAGLIILAPYLHHFFLRLGLLDKSSFASPEAAWKSVHLLQNLCGKWQDRPDEETAWSESALVFNKILCGLPVHEPVPEEYTLSESDLEESEALLNSVRTNWTLMRNSSISTLQKTFFQKKGRLQQAGNNWELIVERDSAVEVLIDRLPWTISMVKLPWNNYVISTQW